MVKQPYDVFVFPGKITASSLDHHFTLSSFRQMPKSLDIYALSPSAGFVHVVVIRLYDLKVSSYLSKVRL